jgi:branched-chain amino acid transport system ATP-binding protein
MMLLDEPTAGHGPRGRRPGGGADPARLRNRTILMVEHNLSVVEGLCDRITVLQRGSVLAEGPYEAVSKNPQVLEAYVGSSDMNDAHH